MTHNPNLPAGMNWEQATGVVLEETLDRLAEIIPEAARMEIGAMTDHIREHTLGMPYVPVTPPGPPGNGPPGPGRPGPGPGRRYRRPRGRSWKR